MIHIDETPYMNYFRLYKNCLGAKVFGIYGGLKATKTWPIV